MLSTGNNQGKLDSDVLACDGCGPFKFSDAEGFQGRDVVARLTFDNEIGIYISNAVLNFREAREGEFYAPLIKGVN
jgi:hypothetical protein